MQAAAAIDDKALAQVMKLAECEREEVDVAGKVGDVCVALDGDEARCDRVDGDAERARVRAPRLRVSPICAFLAVA